MTIVFKKVRLLAGLFIDKIKINWGHTLYIAARSCGRYLPSHWSLSLWWKLIHYAGIGSLEVPPACAGDFTASRTSHSSE